MRTRVWWWILIIFLCALATRVGLQVSAGIIQLGYSPLRLRQEALDVYEGSAWAVYESVVLGLLGLLVALQVRRHAPMRTLVRTAVALATLLVGSVLGMAGIHFVLMRRITELTGQTFGGFP